MLEGAESSVDGAHAVEAGGHRRAGTKALRAATGASWRQCEKALLAHADDAAAAEAWLRTQEQNAEPAADPAVEEAETSLETDALLEACAHGGDLIVARAPVRTAALFAAELLAAAAHLGLPSDSLVRLSPGLWLLAPSDSPSRHALLAWMAALAGVRICGELLLAAPSAAALIEMAHGLRLGVPRWSLSYEVHYPAAEHEVIPFTRLHDAPSLLVGLVSALGPGFISSLRPPSSREAADAAGAADAAPLLLLHCKNGLMMLRERTIDRAPPAASSLPSGAAVPTVGDIAGDDAAMMGGDALAAATVAPVTAAAAAVAAAACPAVAGAKRKACTAAEGMPEVRREEEAGSSLSSAEAVIDTWRLPWWIRPWGTRVFAFSASLDPLIAVAALNLAACAQRARGASTTAHPVHPLPAGGQAGAGDPCRLGTSLRESPLAGMRVYDPCVGSGTVLAAALAHGAAAAAGSDVRAEFVEGARGNLDRLGLPSKRLHLFEHDAASRLSEASRAELTARCEPHLIVSNPPWGKRFGKPEDGAPIVRSMVAQFPGGAYHSACARSTLGGLCPSAPPLHVPSMPPGTTPAPPPFRACSHHAVPGQQGDAARPRGGCARAAHRAHRAGDPTRGRRRGAALRVKL